MLNIEFISKAEENYVLMDTSCKAQKFSNFGYFQFNDLTSTDKVLPGYIKCNEEIINYPKCHTVQFNPYIIKNSLENLLNDFQYKQYDIIKYNCQTFIKNIIEIYNHKNLFLATNEDKCYLFRNYSVVELNLDFFYNVIFGCPNKSSIQSIYKDIFGSIEYDWIDNPKYRLK